MKRYLKQLRSRLTSRGSAGFTVIEAFVGISILLVGLVGPMTLVNNNMQASRFSRDQITAYYLAQEAIEVIRQHRDHQLLAISEGSSGEWYNTIKPDNYPDSKYQGMVDGRPEVSSGDQIELCGIYKPDFNYDYAPCLGTDLYVNEDGEYGRESDSGWSPSRFSRYFILEEVTEDEMRVEVVVEFDTGDYVQEYRTTSYISNWIQE